MSIQRKASIIGIATIAIVCVLFIFITTHSLFRNTSHTQSARADNPLQGLTFYNDPNRSIVNFVNQANKNGSHDDAVQAAKIADEPGATWLYGPTTADAIAERDIDAVYRTSAEAKIARKVPIYVLYAIPKRDVCAGYSQGGFETNADYLAWVRRIINSTQAQAVFIVEPDAIGQTINAQCLSSSQQDERYSLIKQTVSMLHTSRNVRAIYIDATNPEWFPNPAPLTLPLEKSGIALSRGVAVNVSNFIATPEVVQWTQQLLSQFKGTYGAIIDTSRNGNGSMPPSFTGIERWCNPPGRSLGPKPTTATNELHIDAYFWGKNIGESDGSCFGNPPAGTFSSALALEIAKNSK